MYNLAEPGAVLSSFNRASLSIMLASDDRFVFVIPNASG